MPEEVAPNLFRIVVPLPDSPLKAVNCYVFPNAARPLVVDTGMNRRECHEALAAGLDELHLNPGECDFFITHLHADHLGALGHFATPESTVYFNQIEADLMAASARVGGFGASMGDFAVQAGFSEEELKESLENHPGLRFHTKNTVPYTIVGEGDVIVAGEYSFRCIHTPGHSPGHLCLYDEGAKVMLCGDHVLAQISPNISAWHENESPLTDFYRSLEKVRDLEVDVAFGGHRATLTDFRGRVDELTAHHDARVAEVREILDGKSLTAYDVAARMTWDMRYDTWDDVATMQKWFATGEACAHLRHLEDRGLVRDEMQNGRRMYSAS